MNLLGFLKPKAPSAAEVAAALLAQPSFVSQVSTAVLAKLPPAQPPQIDYAVLAERTEVQDAIRMAVQADLADGVTTGEMSDAIATAVGSTINALHAYVDERLSGASPAPAPGPDDDKPAIYGISRIGNEGVLQVIGDAPMRPQESITG